MHSGAHLRGHQKIAAAYSLGYNSIPDLFFEKVRSLGSNLFCVFPGEVKQRYTYDDLFDDVLKKIKKELNHFL